MQVLAGSNRRKKLRESTDRILRRTNKNAVLFILTHQSRKAILRSADYIGGLRREARVYVRSSQIYRQITDVETIIIGSCNGLLCLRGSAEKVLVLNPATRKSHSINLVGVSFPVFLGPYYALGFGYDTVNDEYKVVKISQLFNRKTLDLESELVCYGVRQNSREVRGFRYILHYSGIDPSIGVFVNGALHWICSRIAEHQNGIYVIVGFDLATMETSVISQPTYHQPSPSLVISHMRECLCVFAGTENGPVDVWMMKEYKVKESWERVFSVPLPDREVGYLSNPVDRSLGFSSTGKEFLLQESGKRLVWCDLENPESASTQQLEIRGLSMYYFDSVVCFESLVAPGGQLPPKEVEVEKPSETKPPKHEEDYTEIKTRSLRHSMANSGSTRRRRSVQAWLWRRLSVRLPVWLLIWRRGWRQRRRGRGRGGSGRGWRGSVKKR